ncbi:MAG: cyclic nucleotide-binding domain-containing protein [Desulfobacterales bacterium]|nr:cyclic nucleotide-binding domain-containing protein [Desulfobacterales bacterium]
MRIAGRSAIFMISSVSQERTFPDSIVTRATFRKHEKICRQGDNVSHAIYLTEGTAKLFIEGINGHNIILYLMRPPAYIGLLSFFESIHYTYSVTAIEDSRYAW